MPDHELTDFSFARAERSPEPGARGGLFLHGGSPVVAGDRLRVPLFLAYRVPEPERGAVRDLVRAIVLHVECAEAGLLLAAPLADPEQGTTDYEANFTGNPGGWGDPSCCVEGCVNLTLVLPASVRAASAPVYLHASFFEHVSNTVAVEASPGPDDDAEVGP